MHRERGQVKRSGFIFIKRDPTQAHLAAVPLDALGQVHLGHVQAARIPVAHIEREGHAIGLGGLLGN
jgi:hypothetical protein